MKKVMKDQKGFTLIEMIIALAMVTILFTVILAVLTRTITAYAKMKESVEAMKIADVMGSGMVKELEFAKEITFESDCMTYSVDGGGTRLPLDNTSAVTTTSDSISILGKPKIYGVVFDPGFYKADSVNIDITRANENTLLIQIKIISDASGDTLYTGKQTVHLYNK